MNYQELDFLVTQLKELFPDLQEKDIHINMHVRVYMETITATSVKKIINNDVLERCFFCVSADEKGKTYFLFVPSEWFRGVNGE